MFAYNVPDMEINKILFFKAGAIGDFLQSLPALRALKKKFPSAHVDVVVSSGLEPLIQGTDIANSITTYDISAFRKSFREFIAFGLRLRKERYDLFVDMQSSTRSFILRRLSGADRVLVYRKQKKVKPGERRLHAAENFMEAIRPLGITDGVDRIRLPLKPDEGAAVDRFLTERGINKDKPLIALNCSVGSARPARNWFPERFSILADRLISDLGAEVVFVGGREDRKLVEDVMARMKRKAVSVAGEFPIARTAALLARCKCLVSSDTGPLHLATAVQTPVVGLYGSTDPRRTGPVGPGHTVLLKRLPCVPCEDKHCSFGTRKCMADITVEEVFESVRKVIR